MLAGMHVTVLMHGRLQDQKVAAKAMRRKVLVSPLSLACAGHAPHQGFVLGVGNAEVAQIPERVLLLRQCLRK
jgi:DNA-binding transcriptional MocR family regulator